MSFTLSPFHRQILFIDAAVSGAAGLLMVAGAPFLSPLLGLPESLLFWAGLALLPFVAFLVAVARRGAASRLVLIDIIAINALWVAASFGLLVSGAVARPEAGLFAGLPVLAVVNARALKQNISLIHKHAFAVMNRGADGRQSVSPLLGCGSEVPSNSRGVFVTPASLLTVSLTLGRSEVLTPCCASSRNWSQLSDLNRRPTVYKTVALPLS